MGAKQELLNLKFGGIMGYKKEYVKAKNIA